MEVCAEVEPEPYRTPSGSTVRCHLHTTGPTLAGSQIRLLGDPEESPID
jgi:oligopeptide transport system ATP-binding protein